MTTIQLPPVNFVRSVPFSTRVNYVTDRFKRPTFIDKIHYSFAVNTQRLLQLSFWWIQSPAVANNQYPEGLNFLSLAGLDFYVVGDGQEGEQVISVGRTMPPGYYCVSAYNASGANPHTLDTRMFSTQQVSTVSFTDQVPVPIIQ